MYFGTEFQLSVSYAHVCTYSTVGMRLGMIKQTEAEDPWCLSIHYKKNSKDLRDSCVSVVADKYWNWKESIHEVNSSEFSLELKLTKSYRNLLKLHNISKYMWNQVKLYIRTIFLLISFKTLFFLNLFFLKFMHISGIFIFFIIASSVCIYVQYVLLDRKRSDRVYVEVCVCLSGRKIWIHLFTPCSESHLGSGVDWGGGLGVCTGAGGCKVEAGEAVGAGGRRCRVNRLASGQGWTWRSD